MKIMRNVPQYSEFTKEFACLYQFPDCIALMMVQYAYCIEEAKVVVYKMMHESLEKNPHLSFEEVSKSIFEKIASDCLLQ